MQNTAIEWTDTTWSPIRGCSRVSEGCRNCYAERVAHRFNGPGQPYEGLTQIVNGHPTWTGKVALVEEHLLDPLKWGEVVLHTEECDRKQLAKSVIRVPRSSKRSAKCGCLSRPRRIFVNSMSDLFHENVPDAWIAKIVAVMIHASWHVYQVLTKRPERMRSLFAGYDFWLLVQLELHALRGCISICRTLPDHVHLGVSVEDQKTADERIPLLLQTPAAVRFVSAEPLLGEIKLRVREVDPDQPSLGWNSSALWESDIWRSDDDVTSDGPSHAALDWVTVGGESGKRARPMHPDWARSLRDQCVAAGVPFFFKQGSQANWPNYKDFDSFPPDLQKREFPDAKR